MMRCKGEALDATDVRIGKNRGDSDQHCRTCKHRRNLTSYCTVLFGVVHPDDPACGEWELHPMWGEPVPEMRRRVMGLVVDEGVSQRAAARVLRVAHATVRHHLGRAIADGLIERVGLGVYRRRGSAG